MSDDTIPNLPDQKELEKEIGDYLSRKYGSQVKIISTGLFPSSQPDGEKKTKVAKESELTFNFDLKPEELVAYLDEYVVKQDEAKAVLATKICTHFNRIRLEHKSGRHASAGQIKSNVLLIGPTGVGKTYLIKLIARKIGVPFVKGDATKFSETGYVGGDVEDLVRDLVREADDSIEKAQCGIIYVDEIDKIAASPHRIGADVSRTGVQRAFLKPMEETEVELKVPHDPISQIEAMEPVAISFAYPADDTADMHELKAKYGKKTCLCGYVSPAQYAFLGTPEEMKMECKKQIEELGKDGGFILATGCEFPPNGSLMNAMAMMEAAELYGKY